MAELKSLFAKVKAFVSKPLVASLLSAVAAKSVYVKAALALVAGVASIATGVK